MNAGVRLHIYSYFIAMSQVKLFNASLPQFLHTKGGVKHSTYIVEFSGKLNEIVQVNIYNIPI